MDVGFACPCVAAFVRRARAAVGEYATRQVGGDKSVPRASGTPLLGAPEFQFAWVFSSFIKVDLAGLWEACSARQRQRPK